MTSVAEFTKVLITLREYFEKSAITSTRSAILRGSSHTLLFIGLGLESRCSEPFWWADSESSVGPSARRSGSTTCQSVRSVPAIVVDGRLPGCCAGRGPDGACPALRTRLGALFGRALYWSTNLLTGQACPSLCAAPRFHHKFS